LKLQIRIYRKRKYVIGASSIHFKGNAHINIYTSLVTSSVLLTVISLAAMRIFGVGIYVNIERHQNTCSLVNGNISLII
jgi:hypothetical protein